MTADPPPSDDDLMRDGRRALRLLEDAPEAVQRRAHALFTPAPPRWLRRVQALLSFDSAAAPALALRGAAGAVGARQWLFTAGERDIDLRVSGAGAAWTLEGQVLGPGEGGQIELDRGDGEAPLRLALDDYGAFRAEGLAPGRCWLILGFGEECVELPPVDIGPAPADA